MNVSHRFVVVAAIFVTCLITANIIAVKVISFGSIILPAAILVFPLSYIFGDVLTEVYGYRWARRIIWLGFICNLILLSLPGWGKFYPQHLSGKTKKLIKAFWATRRDCLLPHSVVILPVSSPILLSWRR